MPHAGENEAQKPLLQPRAVRALRKRPRLVDMGVREEVLIELEKNIVERRTADTLAHRVSQNIAQNMAEAGEPVVRNRAKKALDRANESVFSSL